MKQISRIVTGILLAALLVFAFAARRKEARPAANAAGLMPEVVSVAPGPNQVVGEILVRPALLGTVAARAEAPTIVN